MASNTEEIIQDVRTQFEDLLEFVTGEKAQTATADHIERGLFKLLVALGYSLLQLFFVMRSKASSRQALRTSDNQVLPYHRDTVRHYYSIFGKLSFERPYFYKKGIGRCIPLDEALSLGADGYSDLLRELSDYLDVYNVYAKTADVCNRLLGLCLSTRDLQRNAAEDSVDVKAYYDQKTPPQPVLEATILVAQADGKGVPMIVENEEGKTEPVRLGKGQKHGHKKEAIVTSTYTIAPAVRTPEAVADSYFDLSKAEFAQETQKPDGHSRPRPKNKHTWATLEGKDTALSRLAKYLQLLEGAHIQGRVALCDGSEPLQLRILDYLLGFTLVLDFIHASEYLWKVANVLLGETSPLRIAWMAEKTLLMLSGKTDQLITDFREQAELKNTSAAQCTQLNITANYFERNLPYMNYSTYLAKGWPIASGVIEGACRHFVKDRCELSGMRWSKVGAENLLRLRAIAENGDWDDYHAYRRKQRHIRLYCKPYSQPPKDASNSIGLLDSALEANVICEPKSYRSLPLAV